MIHHDFIDRYLCSVDPITLTGLALGGLVGGMMGSKGSALAAAAPTPQAPPAPPASAPAQQQPVGSRNAVGNNTPRGATPTFIGGMPAPPTQSGQKTLLGQ